MNRLLQIAHLGLLLAGAALCVCACLALASMDAAVEGASEATQQAVSGMQGVEQELTATLQAINRPCGAGKPCGTLADVAKTLNSARLTLGQVEIAANHEDSRIGVLDAQEAQIASDAHTLALKAGGTVDALTVAAKGIQPVEQNAAGEISDMRTMTAGLTSMTPDLQVAAAELSATSQNVTQVSQHLNATTADVQQAVHSYLHPGWPKRIWSAITNTGMEAAKFFF